MDPTKGKVMAAYLKDRLNHWNKNPPDYYGKKKLHFTKLLADQPNTSKVNITPWDVISDQEGRLRGNENILP